MWSVPPRLSGMTWSMVKLRNGNSLRHPVAPALLLAEQDVLVLSVRHRHVDVGAGCQQPVVEQVAHRPLQAHID